MQKYGYDTSLTANGGCYICASTNGLVSTDISIEGEGLLALCSGCIHDLAVTAGFRVNGQDEIASLKEKVEALTLLNRIVVNERDEGRAELQQMRETWVAAVEAAQS